MAVSIADEDNTLVRTLSGPGAAGLHHVQWDLTPAGVDTTIARPTPSETAALRWVTPGSYTVTLEAAGIRLSKVVQVVPGGDGVRRGLVRK